MGVLKELRDFEEIDIINDTLNLLDNAYQNGIEEYLGDEEIEEKEEEQILENFKEIVEYWNNLIDNYDKFETEKRKEYKGNNGEDEEEYFINEFEKYYNIKYYERNYEKFDYLYIISFKNDINEEKEKHFIRLLKNLEEYTDKNLRNNEKFDYLIYALLDKLFKSMKRINIK